jgi:hypothetical protein
MQTSNLKRFFAVVPACLLCLLSSGCYYALMPAKHEPIASRKTEDFEFVKWGHPVRSEVEAKLGPPDMFSPNLNVSAYCVEKVPRPRVQLFLFILPYGYFYDYPEYTTAYIKFDSSNRVERYGLMTDCVGPEASGLEYGAKEWLDPKNNAK